MDKSTQLVVYVGRDFETGFFYFLNFSDKHPIYLNSLTREFAPVVSHPEPADYIQFYFTLDQASEIIASNKYHIKYFSTNEAEFQSIDHGFTLKGAL